MAGTEKAGLEGEQRITMSETLKKCSLFPPVIFRNMHEKIIFLEQDPPELMSDRLNCVKDRRGQV